MNSKISGLFIFLLLISFEASSQWIKMSGLDSVSVNSIAIDKTSGGIYATALQGNNFIGLYFRSSIYSTIPWIKIYKGLDTVRVNKITINSAGSLYLATSNGVYYVVNNDSCIMMNQGLPFYMGKYPAITAINIIDNTLYTGTVNGIYRNALNGTNWQNFSQNLPYGAPSRILKYRNTILASYPEDVYRSSLQNANWTGSVSFVEGQHAGSLKINDMSVSDNMIYLAVEGAWSNTYRSIGDSMVFSPAARTSYLTADASFADGNDFYTGSDNGLYRGTGLGNDLHASTPYLPNLTDIKVIEKVGSSLVVGTAYYTYYRGSGGIFYITSSVLASNEYELDGRKYDGYVSITWKDPLPDETVKMELEKYDAGIRAFKKIASISATGHPGNYRYDDYAIQGSAESFLYRVKKIEKSDRFTYSPVIMVRLGANEKEILVYPLPAKDFVNIVIPADVELKHCRLFIYGSTGSLQFSKTLISQHHVKLNLSSLPRGAAYLRLESPDYTSTKTILLQ